jgi:hypothetical protein
MAINAVKKLEANRTKDNVDDTAVVAAVNELIADHATFKTSVDGIETAVEELMDDHATTKTAVDESNTAIDELIDDHATFKTVVDDLKTLTNDIRTKLTAFVASGMVTSAGLAIGSTVQNVSNLIFMYTIGGILYTKAVDAVGVAPGNDVIPSGKFGAVAIDIGADGTLDVIEATDNATGYDSAVLAVAGLPAVGASHVRVGYVTASKSDGDFTFGTTSLGAANTTVAYTSSAGVLAALGAAVGTSTPATLTATKPTAGPATLTAPKPASPPAALTATTITMTET